LGTDPKVLIDEAHHCNVFRSSEDVSLIQGSNVKTLMQQKLEMNDGKCDVQAFGNNFIISVRGLTAETEVNNKNTYDRQKLDTECTPDSVYLKTCLGSEIGPSNLVVAYPKAFIGSSESSISYHPYIYYWNRSSYENITRVAQTTVKL
jgi:hypothetical protein